jgi:transcriptional regulator with XRE-family HTH domain
MISVIVAEMQRKGMNQTDLADAVGMHQGTVSQILTRTHPNNKVATLWRLAHGVGLRAEIRLTRPGEGEA